MGCVIAFSLIGWGRRWVRAVPWIPRALIQTLNLQARAQVKVISRRCIQGAVPLRRTRRRPWQQRRSRTWPAWLGVGWNPVILGELHKAVCFGLNADELDRRMLVCRDTALSGRINAEHVSCPYFKLVAIDIQPAFSVQDDIDFFVSLVCMNKRIR